jgi:hypothetical protein
VDDLDPDDSLALQSRAARQQPNSDETSVDDTFTPGRATLGLGAAGRDGSEEAGVAGVETRGPKGSAAGGVGAARKGR